MKCVSIKGLKELFSIYTKAVFKTKKANKDTEVCIPNQFWEGDMYISA